MYPYLVLIFGQSLLLATLHCLGPPLPDIVDLSAGVLKYCEHSCLKTRFLPGLSKSCLHCILPGINVTFGRGPMIGPNIRRKKNLYRAKCFDITEDCPEAEATQLSARQSAHPSPVSRRIRRMEKLFLTLYIG